MGLLQHSLLQNRAHFRLKQPNTIFVCQKLEDKLFQLREELDQEREKMTQFDMQPITSGTVVPVAASTPTGGAQSQADVEVCTYYDSFIVY